jgi:hypothetical protein
MYERSCQVSSGAMQYDVSQNHYSESTHVFVSAILWMPIKLRFLIAIPFPILLTLQIDTALPSTSTQFMA